MDRSKAETLTADLRPMTMDEASFRSFYQAHHQGVRSVLYRTGMRQDLEDAVQDTFIKAWQSLGQFQQRANVKTWVIRIAINTAIDRFRTTPKELLELSAATDQASDASPFEQLASAQLVDMALEKLSVDHRMIVILQVIEGYSMQEISDILKLPQGTVKSRLHLAKKQLQLALQSLGVEL